ncbi:hypothetical protein SNEBB_000496 [Seison nebaliae]|nr:hypothetical protein SNEBB_000496 [Seison nebaliae]
MKVVPLNIHGSHLISSKFEGLDYVEVNNELQLVEEIKNKSLANNRYKYFMKWVLMLLIGILTGLIGVIIGLLVNKLAEIKYSFIQKSLNHCVFHSCTYHSAFMWVLISVSFVLISGILVAYWEPAAKGSGIPEIKCYLNGVKMPRVVRLSTLIAKVFGVCFSVAGGLAVGKEGPMIHSGSVIGAGLTQGMSSSLKFDCGLFHSFRNDKDKRDFVSAGAAAGVAAAFGAPIGGVLFSLEEGASFWNQSLTWEIFLSSLFSTFTLNLVLSGVSSKFGDFSNPGLLSFGKFLDPHYNGIDIFAFFAIGIIGGALGVIFNAINKHLTIFRQKYIKEKFSRLIECIVLAIVSSLIPLVLTVLWNDCRPFGLDDIKHPVQIRCMDGEMSSMALLWMQTWEESVKSILHDQSETFHLTTLIVFALIYFLLATTTYGCHVPSGLFIPSILCGATWGRAFGLSLYHIFGYQANISVYALMGAAAQLAGNVRMTLSLAVIIMEATGEISLNLPLIICLTTAKFFGDIFNEGIFDMHIDLTSVPFLDWEPLSSTKTISAMEVMTHPVNMFNIIVYRHDILNVLLNTTSSAFPIVSVSSSHPKVFSNKSHSGIKHDHEIDIKNKNNNNNKVLYGIILRHQLIAIILANQPNSLTLTDFLLYYPRYPSIENVREKILNLNNDRIDLTPYIDRSPFSISYRTMLPRIFQLFRGMGLRHLIVVDGSYRVVGIITRKDLARYYELHKGGRAKLREKIMIN